MNILTVVASVSRESINRKLYLHIKQKYQFKDSNFAIELLPFFSREVEIEKPMIVLNWQKKILQADKILWISPEYNHSWPAVGKNAFDWGSRRIVAEESSPLLNKQVYLLGASPASDLSASQIFAEEMFNQTNSIVKHKLGLQGGEQDFDLHTEELDQFMQYLLN